MCEAIIVTKLLTNVSLNPFMCDQICERVKECL